MTHPLRDDARQWHSPADWWAMQGPTCDELNEVLGPNWAICRATPRNKAQYARCLTPKQYEAAEREALRRRAEKYAGWFK